MLRSVANESSVQHPISFLNEYNEYEEQSLTWPGCFADLEEVEVTTLSNILKQQRWERQEREEARRNR
jgi:hypothetical protein